MTLLRNLPTKSPARFLFLLALAILPHIGCGASMTADKVQALGETFKLVPEEKVLIKDADLTVQLKSVRRTWYVDGRGETAEADIIIAQDRKEQRQWMDIGEKINMGDYVIVLWSVDPFGKTSAQLVVTRR